MTDPRPTPPERVPTTDELVAEARAFYEIGWNSGAVPLAALECLWTLADRLAALADLEAVGVLIDGHLEGLHLLRRGKSWQAIIDGVPAWGDTPLAALRALAAALEAECERTLKVRSYNDELRDDLNAARKAMREQAAALEAAGAALSRYGNHDALCPWWDEDPCTCGLLHHFVLLHIGCEDCRDALERR